MNQGNQWGSGSDDRASDGYGSDRDDDQYADDRRGRAQRAGWQNEDGYPSPHAQRQQQADSGGWLSHQQQGHQQQGHQRQGPQQQGGGSDWQGRASQQQGGGNDWRGYSRDQHGGSHAPSSVSSQSGYGGYESEPRRYGGEGRDAGRTPDQRYGSQRQDERERWGDWHQEGASRGSEWQQRGRQSGSQGGQWPDVSRTRGAPWDEPTGNRPDMRTHYTGAYGVSDYDPSPDQRYRGGQRPAASEWLDEQGDLAMRRRQGMRGGTGSRWGESRSGTQSGGYDRDAAAYEQFTGANERSRLNRGFGGAGGSAAARAQRVAPKGYQRSDERIREDLCERLIYSGRLDVREVEVSVSAGAVTLTGSVPDRQQKYRIEDIAEDVFGVKDINNQLRVQRDGGGPGGRRPGGSTASGTGSSAEGTSGGMSGGNSGATSGAAIGSDFSTGNAGSATGSSASSYTNPLEPGRSGTTPGKS
ncbi:BON domain-containing protein [Cupriavidus sp. RAF12]|uniref:BON domain-containing protein n=1 Tax=Cupriavidus sp. RAF12 TaxID=3233050 RepID=UPI003F91E4B4